MSRFLIFSIILLAASAAPRASELERISVTAQRQSLTMAENPLSIATVNDEDLDLLNAIHINQALDRVQGTWISRGNGQEHLTAIRSPVLTGAGGCGAFLIAEDSIPTRASGFCNANQLFEINSEQAGSIEVIRGPGSSWYGSNAVHGIINVISPMPAESTSLLSVETGPDSFLRGKFRVGNDNLLLYGNASHDGGYQNESGYQQQKLNLVYTSALQNWEMVSRLALSNLNQETAGYVQGKQAYKDDALRRTNPNPEAYRNARSMRFHTQVSREWGQHQLSITPYFRYQQMDFLQHYLPWQAIEENSQVGGGVQTLYAWQQQDWLFQAGVDTEWTRGKLTETQPDPFSPAIPQGKHYDYEVIARNLSPFLNLRWEASSNLSLSAGLRYDWQEYDYQSHLPAGSACDDDVVNCRFIRPDNNKVSYPHWSPSVGMIYQLTPTQQLYSNISLGYRAPQATELFRLQQGQALARLDAEQMRSVELGWRGDYQRWFYDLTLYQMVKRNFIFQDADRRNVSNGETRHKGLELALKYRFNPHWSWHFSGSWASHRYANDLSLTNTNIKGNTIDTAPKLMLNSRLRWQTSANTEVELEWVKMGRYYLDPQNDAEYAGHNLVHIRANHQLKDWKVSINLLNIMDKDYAERADFGFGQYRYFVGQPRSLYLALTRKW
ncbi:TonB-dependent receptor [Lacimicrobium alkaliphilum]|uniref:TonB-dependent receptor n=1 Tax=Lacimicrobium alkaliphilum TaxID=1526571 RepID=A0ABQ1QZI8_9ALTE|nr:TonB-dependent receptor [Lacimicrobium alkaliphilum]GGD51216.1 TonB-dependent receptor [Lacimicrobium alkaliphilum]